MKKEIIVYSISDSLGGTSQKLLSAVSAQYPDIILIIVIASLSSIKKRSCWIFYVMP